MIVFFNYEEVFPLCTPKRSYIQDFQVFAHAQHTSFDFQENTLTCLESPLDDPFISKTESHKTWISCNKKYNHKNQITCGFCEIKNLQSDLGKG